MKDLFDEIWLTIRANKLRTCLTGFSIAWGIFMLIILLGAGNGLQNGMKKGFRYMAQNVISLYPSYTSKAYGGMQKGRRIYFTQADVDFLKRNVPNYTDFSAIYDKWNSTITYGKEAVSTNMSGVEPGFEKMRMLETKSGRFLNAADQRERRKAVVIHTKTAQVLFHGGEAVGKYVQIDNVPFCVVGVYENEGGGGNRQPEFYIPYATAQAIFNASGRIYDVSFTVEGIETKTASEQYTQNLRQLLAQRLQFDPTDQNAIWIADRIQSYMQAQTIFGAIALFVWIIGIGTLVAGIVGVSNIMLITVKERTHEFGIRKALGASPASILRQVVVESLTITAIFGFLGMMLGIFTTEGVAKLLEMAQQDSDDITIFANPTVDLSIVLAATAILVVAGVLAGYVPARCAVGIKPIEALQYK